MVVWGYALVFLPTYVVPIILFVLYQYCLIYIFVKKKIKKFYLVIFGVLPMFATKLEATHSWIHVLGLSFMSFRALQVLIDATELPNLQNYSSFLLFFPTILAGPIDRYEHFCKSLLRGYDELNSKNLVDGWRIALRGIACKFILGECVEKYILANLDSQSTSPTLMCANAFGYAAYLYFDFAGYSLMAIGISQMIGINVPENFRYPFLAQNPREFWQRWHITLGNWLRDYVFMPTYKWLHRFNWMKTHPLWRQNISLFTTFQIMGLWNGIAPKYIIEGTLFGFYSVSHNTFSFYNKIKQHEDNVYSPKWIATINMALMLICAIFGLYVFSGRMPFLILR